MSKFLLLYHPKVLKKFKQLHPNDRTRVIHKLDKLSEWPQPSLDIKRLVNTRQSYRLRTGDIRAIFEVDLNAKKIYVWDVDYRGNIY